MSEHLFKYDILLCDLDAFFASVEQRDNPEYRGRPVIVGGSAASRGVVSTCSYEARRFGVHSAMPTAKALQLCPEAIFLPVNMKLYRAVSAQVMAVFERFTPDIEAVSIDEAYLAVPRGAGEGTADRIRLAVRADLRLPITVGVSVNKLLAKIACDLAKPDRVKSLWPEEVLQKLWPLPLKVLPGLGPVSVEKLRRVGIQTVGALAAAPESVLALQLGKAAAADCRLYARGIDPRKLELERRAKSFSEEQTFPVDVTDREMIKSMLMEQAEGLGYRLRAAGMCARTIALKLRFADFSTITRETTRPEATDRDSEIYRLSVELFDRYGGKRPWRLVGTRVTGLETSRQLTLFSSQPETLKEDKLGQVRDRLREKYGVPVLYRARRLSGRYGQKNGPEQ